VGRTDGTAERRNFGTMDRGPRLARGNTCAALIEPPKPIVKGNGGGQRVDERSNSYAYSVGA
jgi:hypothetical protein